MLPYMTTPNTARDMDAVVDRFVVSRRHEKAIKAGIAAARTRALVIVGLGIMSAVSHTKRRDPPASAPEA